MGGAKIPVKPLPTTAPAAAPTNPPNPYLDMPKPTLPPPGYSYTEGPVLEVDTDIESGQPCKMLLSNDADPDKPYKFREYLAKNKCRLPLTCKNRDVAAI